MKQDGRYGGTKCGCGSRAAVAYAPLIGRHVCVECAIDGYEGRIGYVKRIELQFDAIQHFQKKIDQAEEIIAELQRCANALAEESLQEHGLDCAARLNGAAK